MIRLPHRSDYENAPSEKWLECCLCGTKLITALVHFDSGSVSPTQGETVTGATSGHTMVMDKATLISGTYAGGDAVGVMCGTSPAGYDAGTLELFQDNEALNGSTSGNNFATVNLKGAVQISGRLIPESDIVEYKGKNYCRVHFRWRFNKDFMDEARIEPGEGDRD